jgi:hypothetical protein
VPLSLNNSHISSTKTNMVVVHVIKYVTILWNSNVSEERAIFKEHVLKISKRFNTFLNSIYIYICT